MQQLADQGMLPAHLALLLETIADGQQAAKRLAEATELVWTGAEPSGSTSRDTSVVVPEMFGEARSSVLVAGYAVYQGRHIFRRLAERMDESADLKVRMFLNVTREPGDSSAESEILQRFAHDFKTRQWPGRRMPELCYDPRALAHEARERASLHAKCIVVDREAAFVSSANFTEAALNRNIEAGVLIRSIAFARQLEDHFETLVQAGLLRPIPSMKS